MFPRPPELPGRPERPERKRSAAAEAARARPSARLLSRRARDRFQQRLLLAGVGCVGLGAALIVGFGALWELVGYPNEPVAIVAGEKIALRAFTDSLADEMRNLQSQVALGAREETNPAAAGSQVQRLIEAQEKLPEEVLEKEIEQALIRQEAARRGITISGAEIDAEINKFFSLQRDILNQPTPTPTATSTPRPTATATPEGWDPTPTATRTVTPDPLTPSPTPTVTPTPTLSPTLDPAVPTPTRTPWPTRLTATPIITPSPPATMEAADFERAYNLLRSQVRSEARYRAGVELQLLRDKLHRAIGANLPTSGPQARVLRLATSTKDEATVARLQLVQFEYPFEEVLAQATERPAHGRTSGDLGWVALGAETPEFDQVVFSPDTSLDEWTEPFSAGNHWGIVMVRERREQGVYDERNLEKMRARVFQEWLDGRKSSPEVERDLSPHERQWAVDRGSKGIIETTEERRRR